MKLGKTSKVEGSSYLHSPFETQKRPHSGLLHINPRGSSTTRQREVISFNFRIGYTLSTGSSDRDSENLVGIPSASEVGEGL